MSVGPTLPLISYVTLGKLPNVSELWFPCLINECVLMNSPLDSALSGIRGLTNGIN